MRRYLSRRLVYILFTGLTVLHLGYTLPTVGKVRDRVASEYFKHKEFLLNLKLVKGKEKSVPTESDLREFLRNMGIEPESLYSSDTGVEVKFELSWKRLPELVKRVERRYRIVSFSAVDNTGKGLFKVRMVVE
ncbi:hypothetical protein [Hydrogenivirga sp. 128-5-R1-1]|uniref:hypothetical protein n=1 Tax=Hydrogenivirga sp. 128-5-R1-1 TaxID=392423 RepID=UPI00015EF837|nr:hypothetical protein [Hydrogenivirga sp. 128-5-R1-1]EDP75744.1 hypothetical protein HG1285_17310 [Hydrogenivirga sp. 128-5-R1-1]